MSQKENERQARKLAAGREKQIDQHTDREAGPLETPADCLPSLTR